MIEVLLVTLGLVVFIWACTAFLGALVDDAIYFWKIFPYPLMYMLKPLIRPLRAAIKDRKKARVIQEEMSSPNGILVGLINSLLIQEPHLWVRKSYERYEWKNKGIKVHLDHPQIGVRHESLGTVEMSETQRGELAKAVQISLNAYKKSISTKKEFEAQQRALDIIEAII